MAFTAGLDGEARGSLRLLWAGELAPGVAVRRVEAVVGAIARKDVDAFAAGKRFDGDDDPGVFGKDVTDEEVDFVGGVGDRHTVGAALRGDEVRPLAEAAGGFHLHADEAPAGVDDEVVAITVAVRLGNGESQAGGLK